MLFPRSLATSVACLVVLVTSSTPHGAARIARPSSPGPDTATATSGLELTLGDSSSDARPQATTPHPGTELPADDSAALLRRLPDLKPSDASTEARLPPASLPPPRAGRTRLAVFPPEGGAPPVT